MVLVLTSTLLLSVLLNLVLLKKVDDSFIKLQALRNEPLKKVIVPNYSKTSDKRRVVFLGDSRAQMWSSDETIKKNTDLYNYGVGGYSSQQVLNQLESINSDISKSIVVLQVGINDFHWIGQLDINIQNIRLDRLKANTTKIINLLLENDNEVILTTIFPPQNPSLTRALYWPKNGNEIILDVNLHLHSLANSEGVYLLDSFKLLVDARSGLLDTSWNDQDFFLHINNAGYSYLNNELRKMLFKVQ